MKVFTLLSFLALLHQAYQQDPTQTVVSHTNADRFATTRRRQLQSSNLEIEKFLDQMNCHCPKFTCNGTVLGNQCANRLGVSSDEVQLHACGEGLSCDLMQTSFLMRTVKDFIKDQHSFFRPQEDQTVDTLKSQIQHWKQAIDQQFYTHESQCNQREILGSSNQILEQFWYILLNAEGKYDPTSTEGTICEQKIDFCQSKDTLPYSQTLAQECESDADCPYVIPAELNRRSIGIAKGFQGMTGSGPMANQEINIYRKNEQIPKQEFGKCECAFDGKRRCSLTLGDQHYCSLMNQVCDYARGSRNFDDQEVKQNVYLSLFYHKVKQLPKCWTTSFPRHDWICKYVSCA